MHDTPHHHETNDPLIELRDLLAAFEAGELTDAQDHRLQQLVAEHEPVRHEYLRYMFMYGKIHQKHRGQKKTTSTSKTLKPNPRNHANVPPSNCSIFPLLEIEKDLLSAAGDISEFGNSKTSDSSSLRSGGFFGNINFSFVPTLITIVAAVLILSGVVILPIYWATRPTDPKWAIVARITKAIDCRWAQGEKWSQEGMFLTAGQLLDLEVGLVEVEFSSGAKVVLQGPARFVTAGPNDSRLDHGRLSAIVPEGAEGFTVRTPGMEVVDLGTEFGVSVNENNKSDVHVFKGLVEMESATKSGKTQTIQLKKNEAAEYDKASGDVIHIPVNNKKFVRDLDAVQGITTNLRVVNPSFEVPDIRTVPEYQPEHGDTQLRPIHGWKISDPNQAGSRIAMYQISPYTAPDPLCNVGPGATDGRQVVTVSIGQELASASGRSNSNWIYQSLGTITTADIGKTLKLSVDAGKREQYVNKNNGTLFAGFALHVTPELSGTVVGKPGSFTQEGKMERLQRLEATLPITVELVGQEVYILLAVSNKDSAYGQYHFDNVQIMVED